MKRSLLALAALVTVAASASAQETALLGVRLFDKATKVIALYGTPDAIQPAGGGGVAAVGGGGRGGGGFPGAAGAPGGGPPAGGTGRRPSSGGTSGGASASGMTSNPYAFEDGLLRQASPRQGGPPPGVGGPPSGFPGQTDDAGSGAGGRGGAPAAGGGAATSVTLTRWVYNRGGSRYGFIINKLGRVVQIEALGLENRRVRTKKGVGFGSTFATIIRGYGAPDGYEIQGDDVLVKYLSRQKVAFRLSRLGPKKPQVVIGVVVSAGKA